MVVISDHRGVKPPCVLCVCACVRVCVCMSACMHAIESKSMNGGVRHFTTGVS